MNFEECKQIINDNFRSIKLEKDYAQFQLLLFQIKDLMSHYEKLIELQNEIQSKFYITISQLEKYDFLSDFDYVKWNQAKTMEVTSWKQEVDILNDYKYQIFNILKQIEDGTIEQLLIKQEREFK